MSLLSFPSEVVRPLIQMFHCYYSFALILVFIGFLGFVASVFTFLVYVQDFLFHIRDSFINLFVSVVVFVSFSQWLCSFHGAGFRLNLLLSAEICPSSHLFFRLGFQLFHLTL